MCSLRVTVQLASSVEGKLRIFTQKIHALLNGENMLNFLQLLSQFCCGVARQFAQDVA
jgi:hypothetical protein